MSRLLGAVTITHTFSEVQMVIRELVFVGPYHRVNGVKWLVVCVMRCAMHVESCEPSRDPAAGRCNQSNLSLEGKPNVSRMDENFVPVPNFATHRMGRDDT